MTTTSIAGTSWFRRHRPAGETRLQLVCLPHAGGAATFFHGWGGAVGDGVEVLAARYPGRQERIAEPCLTDMTELADAVAGALIPLLDHPVALFGHSMGASLAYEVALRLERHPNARLTGLFVSSREAPHRTTPKTLHLGSDASVFEEVERLGGADMALPDDPAVREMVLPALRADFEIAGTYRASEPLPLRCPVVAYAGDQDPGVSERDMRLWSEVAGHEFDLRMMPGGHFYLVAEQQSLQRDISRRLNGSWLASS
ncbi:MULTISPECIES: thioesterase II family protein [unclassified Streptomyces]|uniref:thioesterase II family protein n=1 Tax=unclassified Streptomyces TaxID=2593676 RepID=UPI0037A9A5CB